jgi:hypothetical protein
VISASEEWSSIAPRPATGGEPSAQVIAVRRGLRGGDAGEGEVELLAAREDVACGFVR